MAERSRFVVVIGTDGSASGHAAVEGATRFPWPARAEALLVVATRGAVEWSPAARALAQGVAQPVGASALRTLRRRWPAARASYPLQAPSGVLLAASRSVRARRHRGGIRRARRARTDTAGQRVAAGGPGGRLPGARCQGPFEASALLHHRSGRVCQFPARGRDGGAPVHPPGGQVTLVSVIEPRRVPSGGLMPARIGGALRAEAARLTAARRREAGRGPAAAGGPASPGRLEGAGSGPRRHAPGGVARRGECQPDRCTRHRGPRHRRCRAAACLAASRKGP